MQSTDETPSRMAVAKQRALELVEDMSKGDRMAVLAFSDHAEVMQSLTDDKAALRRAVNSIEAVDTDTRMGDSLAIARALALANKNAEIYIISDGGIRETDFPLEDLPRVAFVGVGTQSNNVGIIDLDLRESVGRQRESELFVGVRNFSDRTRRTTLRLLLDGELVDAKELELAPLASQSEIFRNITATDALVEVRLDVSDDLAADNVAYGILHLKREIDILLVSAGNYFLERLLGVNEDFKVSRVAPASYAPGQPYDLVIFDNWSPPEMGPGSYLMFRGVPPLDGVKASTQTVQNPLIVDWHRLHPLTRYVNFEPVSIESAMRLTVPSWSQVLAEGIDAPMIVLFEDRHLRCLVIAFSVFDSDWPLHISFPVFLSNAVRWLSAFSSGQVPLCYRAGETVRLNPPSGEATVGIENPLGRTLAVERDEAGEAFFAGTERAGLYTVRAGEDEAGQFAVNLLSEGESNTSPTKVLSFQGRLLESQPQRLRSNREVWFWFALAALIVLMIEWMIYCRRSSL
jgi:hypothetical protein